MYNVIQERLTDNKEWFLLRIKIKKYTLLALKMNDTCICSSGFIYILEQISKLEADIFEMIFFLQ